MDVFLGTILAFPFNFAPRGWAFCEGQLLPIAQNTALFSLLGTTYGGNGQTTFALPDLRGRVAIHADQGPGLSPYVLGQVGGAEVIQLTAAQLPVHNHDLVGSAEAANSASPAGAFLAKEATGVTALYGTGSGVHADAVMAAGSVTGGGQGQAHSNLQPYLVLNYCIALEGIFPSRN